MLLPDPKLTQQQPRDHCSARVLWGATKTCKIYYVDFAGDKLSIIDQQTGEIKPVEVFVAILGASQLTYVEAVMTQQRKISFLRARTLCIIAMACLLQ